MSSCCACCCFYPKYKRKVDNIYPRNIDSPLVKNEVDKLQYYVTIHPEKLSKIGDYLYQNLKSGLHNTQKYRNYVKNTIEAVEKILVVITPQNLNYFAPSYLKIIQKLLEQGGAGSSSNVASASVPNGLAQSSSNNSGVNAANNNNNTVQTDNLEYQKLAANLFKKFCEKEALNLSTTNYNLNYDTFVCQFSSMCYNNNKNEQIRVEIRSSGLQCLDTMVKRLVPDDSLRAGYFWDNMDKIIPALLFIMHENFLITYGDATQPDDATYDIDEEQHQLNRYLYSEFYTSSRASNTNPALNEENPNQDEEQVIIESNQGAELDRVRIQFRKSTNNNGQAVQAQPNSSGESSQADEANLMMNAHRNMSAIIDPDHEAKMLLKNIASKADYTTISKIVLPIFTYLDDNKPTGWEHSKFVRCIFLIVMYNVKQQHAIVIKELIKHLDSHRNSSAQLKCYIIRAISICIRIAAMNSVGTAGQIIEIITNLLKHLNFSVEKVAQCQAQLLTNNSSRLASTSSNSINKSTISAAVTTSINNNSQDTLTNKIANELNEQRKLQYEIILAMGQFTSHLPDYSKNDVIMFIAHQINSQHFNYNDLINDPNQQQQSDRNQLNSQLRTKYFECLHEICTKYRPTQLFSAFTSGQFLEDILRLTLVSDWMSRRKAHEILHLLLDRYQLLNKIKILKPNLFYDSVAQNATGKGVVTIIKSGIGSSSSSSSLSRINDKRATKLPSLTSLSTTTRNQTYLSQLDLDDPNSAISKFSTSKEDIHFMRKYGRIFLAHLNENLFLKTNRRENYEMIYLTVCFFLIGLFNEKEFLVDLIRFGFHIQELALLNYEQPDFTFNIQCNIHKFICAYFLLLSKSSGVVSFYRYCSEVCDLRRKKDLFKFVYPEYILLDSVQSSYDSGIQSTTNSLSEVETEFKRDLAQSSKEYYNSISSKQSEDVKPDDNRSSKAFKMAPWLFDKKTIGEILESAGFSTTMLFIPTNEYSLSISYLQQTIGAIQTVLKYRSPNSNSYDSITGLNQSGEQTTSNTGGLNHHHGSIANNLNSNSVKMHSRVHSGHHIGVSPSLNQFINTPRRSIDVESNNDDDTSYDSTSQISVDQNGLAMYDLDYQTNQKLFFLDNNNADNNQISVNSLNVLQRQQQLYMQQQQYQDLSSFDTIKKVLFNGNNNLISSNLSSSGVGAGGNSTVNGSSLVKNQSSNMMPSLANGDLSEEAQAELNEKNMKIITDFKQKNYDELKQNLVRANQMYVNSEKYQQVFDLISKELVSSHASTNTAGNISNSSSITLPNSAMNSSSTLPINGSITNMNGTGNISASNGPTNGGNSNSNLSNTSNVYPQKSAIPLNDIEFPQLFMY